jgi:ATP-binding cassette subfamily F protein uup
MAILTVQNLVLRFGGPPLLDNAAFTIEPGERVCLVGRNGEGKSTILKLLNGDMQPNSGEFIKKPSLRIARLIQEVPETLPGTIRDIVAIGTNPGGKILFDDLDWEHQHAVESTISRLGLDPDLLFNNLSGGQRRRALLGQALVSDPDLLLLDEPTNHLDIPSIQWLEDMLMRLQCALLFVSHDRSFVRKLATRILELDRGKVQSWECNYDKFIERRDAMLADEAKASALFDKRLAEEEVWIRKGIKARRTRNEGRVRALESLREERRNRRERQGSVQMEILEADRSGKIVIKGQELTYHWPDKSIMEDFTCRIMRGDRVGIVGSNGSGKTTLLRVLLGELEPKSGNVVLGTNLQVAYFDQMRGQLRQDQTLVENIGDGKEYVEIGGGRKHIMGYLSDFLFSADRARGPISALSGGERNRLLLARLFSRPSNVLVLDEPTNDLDIETLDLLEELLADYSGTVLCVSHDRDFLDRICSSLIVLESPGYAREFVGGYEEYRKVRELELIKEAQAAKAAAANAKSTTKGTEAHISSSSKRKLSFKEQREYDTLPATIDGLEIEIARLHEALAKPEAFTNHKKLIELQNALEKADMELMNAFARWETLEN